MYEQFSKKDLAEQCNKARKVAILYAAKIYSYIAGDITKEELYMFVKNSLSPEIEKCLYHKLIQKDYLGSLTNTFDIFLDDETEEDTTIDMNIKNI